MGIEDGREADLGERIDELLYRWEELRRRPVVAVAVVGVVAAVTVVAWLAMGWRSSEPTQRVDDRIPVVTLAPTVPSTTATGPILVHVAGAVGTPGVYELGIGDRVLDAIELAGGATAQGEPDRLNLAAPVADGMQIRVPVAGEAVAIDGGAGSVGGSGPVDLNTASASQLESLPGVGPATAAAILAYRAEVGRFASVSDLLGVRGIGEAKLDAIRGLVTVS